MSGNDTADARGAAADGDPAASWSRLWRAGVLHSCATGIQGNYDGAIGRFWWERFIATPDGARIVDLGTGNGALPLLAKEVAGLHGARFELHGIDLADIDPASSIAEGPARYAGIVFHPRTPADRLPFPDSTVQLVTAHYAFEYTPWESTLAEVARVTAPGGRVALLVHSRDSLVCATAAEQLAACRFLFEEHDFLARARAVLAVMERMGAAPSAGDAHADSIREAFNAAASSILEAIARRPRAEILRKAVQHVSLVLRQAGSSPVDARRQLDEAEASLRGERVRLQQLSSAIMDLPALRQVATRFAASGFVDVELAPIDQQPGARMGWTLVAARG